MARRVQIRALEVRVANLIVQLSTHPSSSSSSSPSWDSGATQRVYTAARQHLARLKAAINEDDDVDAEATHYWKRRCRRLDRELVSTVAARRRRDLWQAERAFLDLSSSSSSSPPSSAVEEAEAITESLERTHEMMRGSLQVAEGVGDTVCSDGRVIDDTFDQHRGIKSATTSASRLLRRMQHQQREDQWKLRGALAVFGLVCCFILLRRLPGVGVLLWKTTDRFDGNNQAPHVYNRRTLHLHHDENTSANDEADSDCRRGSSARTPDNFGLDIESDSRSKTDSGGSGGGESADVAAEETEKVTTRSAVC